MALDSGFTERRCDMGDIVDDLRYMIPLASDDPKQAEVIDRAIGEIVRLRSLVGKADVGPSFVEVTKGMSRRSIEPGDLRSGEAE